MSLSYDMVPDEGTEGFSFIWSIQNFMYCLQKRTLFISPSFKLNLSDANEWCLRLFPISDARLDEIGIFLFLISSDTIPIKVKICFSVRDYNGTFKTRKNSIISAVYREGGLGFNCFLNHSELYDNGDNTFLKNNTLTLRCRILQEDPELSVSGLCYARTEIEAERITFDWSMENFKELLQNEKKTYTFRTAWSAIPIFTLHSFLSEVDSEKQLKIQIKYSEAPENMLWTWEISLLNAEGKAVQSTRKQHWSEALGKKKTCDFAFMPVGKILDNENLYLTNGTLSLRCEFVVFTGEEYSTRERTEYVVNQKRDATHSGNTLGTSNPKHGNYNLELFYNEGKFSDLIIRTASGEVFPVHKAILCARSEVFNANFDPETNDNQPGVVYIEDFNDDTVYKMLLFAYTGSLDDLNWKTVLELYSASDKYGFLDLKKGCYDALIENMNQSNVCEILLKAHMLRDRDMKSAAEDFMWNHGSEFMLSEYWFKFKQENSDLANETLQVLYTKSTNRILLMK